MATDPTGIRELLQVQPPDELSRWTNSLIYAEAGVGKTTLLGTAADHPETSPVLIFDIEGGTKTLRKKPEIDIVRVHSLAELKKKFNHLFKSINEKGELYYKTVGVDSVTELCSLDMVDIMKEAYGKKPDTVDIDVPSPREWGKSGAHMREIVRAFKELPCHVIFTCLRDQEVESEGDPTSFFPKFHGKTSRLRMEIPGFVDILGYMYVETKGKEPIRKIQFAKTRRILAKDRYDVLGDTLLEPTFPKMWSLIYGTKE